jgi:hypothetical protein
MTNPDPTSESLVKVITSQILRQSLTEAEAGRATADLGRLTLGQLLQLELVAQTSAVERTNVARLQGQPKPKR